MPKLVVDEKVYHATMQTVIERGYAGATTKQIADAAKISEVTLFRKYGDKAQLIKQAITATLQQMDMETAVHYTGDVSNDLLSVVQTYQDAADKSGHFFPVIITEVPRYPELADLLDAPMEIISKVGQLVARYQAEGILRKEHPLHAVTALIGPLISINMIRGASMDNTLPPLDLQNHVTFFLNGRIRPR